MASMENGYVMGRTAMENQNQAVCVRDCTNCVKAREAGLNFRGQNCYTCRKNAGEPETLRHLSRSDCESHEFPEEKYARLSIIRPDFSHGNTRVVQLAAF